MLFLFLAIASVLAAAQFVLFHGAGPSPDTIAYMEIADQIAKNGYFKAVAGHWSPLYAVFIFTSNQIANAAPAQENTASIAAYAALLVAGVAVSFFFHERLKREFVKDEPSRLEDWKAWTLYGIGFTVYFLFSVHKITLRLPDGLVFVFALALLSFLCAALRTKLAFKAVFIAGLFGGLAYLTRANLLYWSIGAGGLACIVLGAGTVWTRRVAAMAVFILGVSVFALPQIGVLSSQKGRFSMGAGTIPLAEVYGARWPNGQAAWPEKTAGGDVRIFHTDRTVHYPGFYEPEREYEDAVISYSFTKMIRGNLRAVQSLLFGFWSPTYALLWPLLIAFLPVIFFGLRFRRPEAVFLTVCGAAGITMHLFSFCIGYYLGAYLVALFAGLTIAMLDSQPASESAAVSRRALRAIGVIFILAAFLTTFSYFRLANRRAVVTGNAETRELAKALREIPREGTAPLRLAFAGEWLGLYAVRLADAQVYAEIQNLEVLRDSQRAASAVEALKKNNIRALIVPDGSWQGLEPFAPKPLKGTRWMRVDL